MVTAVEITERRLAEKEIHDLNANLEFKVEERTQELLKTNEMLNRNIENLKKAEEEIIKSRDQATKANQAKTEFLSRVSHELRTPMNSILGFAQLMQMGELTSPQKTGISHILTSGKHLLNLIDEVLGITRIEAGKLALLPEPVQLMGIISETIDAIHPMANARKIVIELKSSLSNQLFAMSDRMRLKQVLINLLSNAVKFNRHGGSVSVKTEKLPVNDSGIAFARISVTDTGLGIPAHDIPKLFIPFERIGAEKTDIEGTGLGLAVTKRIMDAMAGAVGVESIVGEGATFWIDLPITEKQIRRYEPKENHATLTDQTENKFKTGKSSTTKAATIIYIEDNILNACLVEEITKIHRPEMLLITSIHGQDAVRLAIDHSPDLILLDLDLPDIQGSHVLANLRTDDKTATIPVVIISADATPQQIERFMAAGANDYLTKPLDITMFLRVVDTWVNISKQVH